MTHPPMHDVSTSSPSFTPSYGTLFRATLQIVWRHPILWVAGIITVVLQGNANFNVNFSTSQPMPTIQSDGTVDLEEFFAGTYLEDMLLHPVRYLLLSLLLVTIFLLVRLIFGTWAKAALIRMGINADTAEHTSLGSGWRQVRSRLPALIGFEFLLLLPLILLFGGVAAVFVPIWFQIMRAIVLEPQTLQNGAFPFDPSQFGWLFCLIPLFVCIGLPLNIAVQLIDLYGFRSCLLAGTSPLASIVRGWRLFVKQIGYTLLTALLYFVAAAVAGALILAPLIPFYISIATSLTQSDSIPELIRQILPLLLYAFVASVIVTGILQAFFATLWTKIYAVAEVQLVNNIS